MLKQSHFASIDQNITNLMRRWHSMFDRCYNKNCTAYNDYGARGIKIDKRWQDFRVFYFDMGLPPSSKHSLGRIDNDGDYCKSNCRWETQAQQNNNTRRSKYIEYRGKRQTLKDWAKEFNIGTARLSERLRRGWSIERALTTPCPKNHEQERQEHKRQNDRYWFLNGHIYKARSDYKKGKLLTEQRRSLLREATSSCEKLQEKAVPTKTFREKIPVETFQEIFNLKKNGSSLREIARITKIPKSTIHVWLSKYSAL